MLIYLYDKEMFYNFKDQNANQKNCAKHEFKNLSKDDLLFKELF